MNILLDNNGIEHFEFYLVLDSCKSKLYRRHTKEREITDCKSYIRINPDDNVSFELNEVIGSIC